MVENNNKFRRSLKYVGILSVINLLYLNLFLPLKISFEQIFLICAEVVRLCDERGLDVSKLSPSQLDQIISLSLNSVRKVFQENGFRFIPNINRLAYASGELVPIGSFSRTVVGRSVPGETNPYGSAVRTIIKGNALFGNLYDCVDRLTIVCRNFVSEIPNSGKFYLASKGIFLMLNVTNVQYAAFRYIVWAGSTIIQVYLFPGDFQSKLPMIVSSLVRDCHLQIFEVVRPILAPLLGWTKPLLLGIFYKLPFIGNDWYIPLNKGLNWTIFKLAEARNTIKRIPLVAETYNFLEAAFHFKIVAILNRFRIQYVTLSTDSRRLVSFALETYHNSKKPTIGVLLDGPYQSYPISNLPIAYKTTGSIAKVLGRAEVNISILLARTGAWLRQFDELDKVLRAMPIPERRRFERLVAMKWMRGEDMSFRSKITTLFQNLAGRFMTRGKI